LMILAVIRAVKDTFVSVSATSTYATYFFDYQKAAFWF
jgi:hypothetical protein